MSFKRIAASIFLLLAWVSSASGFFGSQLKTASGDFFSEASDCAGVYGSQSQYPCRENGCYLYDIASGSTVWTYFDPLGLKFDDETFDSDNDRAKNWSELSKKTQDSLGDKGATEGSYDKSVNSFNESLEELTETPFGSAQYDYLKKADQEFSFSFGYHDGGQSGDAAAYFQAQKAGPYDKQGGRGGRFHFNAGNEDLGTIAHEFTHGIQDIGSLSRTKWKGAPSILSSVAYSGDSKTRVPGQTTPRWKEAQAERAKNIAVNEYGVMNATKARFGNETFGFIKNPHWSPSVDELRNTGDNHYDNRFTFDNVSGSYQYNQSQPNGGPSISEILESRR